MAVMVGQCDGSSACVGRETKIIVAVWTLWTVRKLDHHLCVSANFVCPVFGDGQHRILFAFYALALALPDCHLQVDTASVRIGPQIN